MKIILLSIAMLSAGLAQAQYTFSTFTEPYQELGESTQLAGGGSWDDPGFILEFGFPFAFGGETFTQATQTGLGAGIEFFAPPVSHLFGYGSDIIDGESIGESPSTISYAVEGIPSNRIYKLQYFNCAFYNDVYADEPSAESRVNFQIWLYESDGAIEFRFGTNTITATSEAHDGLPGPHIYIAIGLNEQEETFEYAVNLKGNPSNPEAATPTFQDDPEQLDGNPESGRVYRFTPSVVSTEQAETPRFSVYPTIVEQRLNIAGDFAPATAYRILSVDGRLVQSGKLTSEIIELGDLARGSYVLHLDGSPKAAKFIKN